MTVQVIVDGHHLAGETVIVAWQAASGRFALVTDAVAAAGMGDGDSCSAAPRSVPPTASCAGPRASWPAAR